MCSGLYLLLPIHCDPLLHFPNLKKKKEREEVARMFLTSDGEVEGPLEYVAKTMQEFPFLKRQRGERKWPLCEDISKSKMVATWLNKYKRAAAS